MPYVWDPNLAANDYVLAAGANHPQSASTTGIAFPNPTTTRATAPPAGSDFDPATWRSLSAAQLRLNLNRTLRNYPAPNAVTGLITNTAAYNRALKDRQDLAADIFAALRKAAGTVDPTTNVYGPTATTWPATLTYGSTQFNALRYLAQLSVNMVDYIDDDNDPAAPTVARKRYMTWFEWYNQGGQGDVVYGTELPELVLNEAYVQVDNDPNDAGIKGQGMQNKRKATTHYNVNVWVELHNPLSDGANETNTVTLQQPGGNLSYELQLVPYNAAANINTVYNNVANTRGDPSFGGVTPHAGTPTTVNTYSPDAMTVQSSNNAFSGPNGSNVGFYVVGPNTTFLNDPNDQTIVNAEIDPNLPTTHQSAGMTYQVPVTTANGSSLFNPVVLLRRLACPHLIPQNNPALALYNPYVTVDMIRTTHHQDARAYRNTGANNGNATPNRASRASYGRKEPYFGQSAVAQTITPIPNAAQPKNTFYQHNYDQLGSPTNNSASATLNIPFHWLTHLDRQIISPLELLHVSACTCRRGSSPTPPARGTTSTRRRG
jgi:hypothetical protein